MRRIQMSRRRVVGAAAAAPILAACGGPAASGATESKALPPAKILFFTHWGGGFQLEGQKTALAAFEQENPGQTVEMVTGAAVADKIIPAVAGGTPPDLIAQSAGRLIPMAAKNLWRGLDDLIKKSAVVKRANYEEAQVRMFSWKGKWIGVPAFESFGMPALAYNWQHFVEAGLDPSKPPITPNEVMQAHERLTRIEGGEIKRLGLDPRDAAAGSYPNWANTWGVKWWDPDKLKLNLNDSLMVEAHDWIASFYRQDRLNLIAEFRKVWGMWTGPKSGITVGAQSMQLNGYWTPGELAQQPERPARMGYSWWPNPKGSKVAIWQGWSGAVPNASKLPEHGFRLVEFFASVKGGQIMFDHIGWLNGSKQLLKEGNFSKVPDLKFFLEMPSKADKNVAEDSSPVQLDIIAEYAKGIEAVVQRQTTAKAMLDDLQARMSRLLEDVLRAS